MTISEKTFADRLGRGSRLLSAVELFEPDFAPADVDLAPASFGPYLDSLDATNLAVGEAIDVFRVAAGERVRFVRELKPLTTRIINYVKSNKAWNKHLPSLKSVADKLRGYRNKKVAPPRAGGDTEAQTRARQTGEQSFADIAGLFSRLVGALEKIEGYAPPAAEISLASLQVLATQLIQHNEDVPNAEQELKLFQKEQRCAPNTAKKARCGQRSAGSGCEGFGVLSRLWNTSNNTLMSNVTFTCSSFPDARGRFPRRQPPAR